MAAGTGVRERAQEVWPELGPAERRVARFVLDHADELAGYSGSELAGAAGASKATVSRFFRRLGFASYAVARADARTDAQVRRSRGVPLGGLPDGEDTAVSLHVAHDAQNLARAAENLARVDLDAVAGLLARAHRVVVVGWRNSFPVALHLREQLLQARPDVAVAPHPGQTLAEEVADLDAQDVVVVVAFRRRTPAATALLERLRAQEVPRVLLTDPTGPFPAAPATHRIEVPVQGPGAFDSYAAVMSTVAVLAEQVLARRGRTGPERVTSIAVVHGELGELERS